MKTTERLGRYLCFSLILAAFLVIPMAALPVAAAGPVGVHEIIIPDDWDGTEKIQWEYCYTDVPTGSYYAVYNNQSDNYICFEVSILVSNGNTNLYMVHQAPWFNPDPLPPYTDGALICQSTNSGSTNEHCDGCDHYCIYANTEIWMNYGVVASGPSDSCMTGSIDPCEGVDVVSAESRRDGNTVHLEWEITEVPSFAGFNVLRRIAPESAWTKVNSRLITTSPTNGYQFVDQLPIGAGEVEYRLQEVALDGVTTNLVRIISHATIDAALD